MSARDQILARVQAALRNPPAPAEPPPVMLRVPTGTMEERVAQFTTALEKLAGQVHAVAGEAEAADCVRAIAGARSIYSTHPLVASTTDSLATADVGVTGAAYALADTGSLVMLSAEESRLASLLPPIHVAVVRRDQIVSGLDELLTAVPLPAERSASLVVITGPSRTADIEQILVRGVHGPGELHVVLIDGNRRGL